MYSTQFCPWSSYPSLSGRRVFGFVVPFEFLASHTQAASKPSTRTGVEVDPRFGVNPSDLLLVTAKGGLLMSSLPYSREWSFLTL